MATDKDFKVKNGLILNNDNSGARLTREGNYFRNTTQYGYIQLGPNNTGFAHIDTDRTNFYFSKKIQIDSGEVSSYNEDLFLQRAGSTKLTLGTSTATFANDVNINSGNLQIGGTDVITSARAVQNITSIVASSDIFAGNGGGIDTSNKISTGGGRSYFGYDGATQQALVQSGSGKNLTFRVDSGTFGSGTLAMLIGVNNDISFYEDTGTTPKLRWDSSEERLGIGTISPSYPLDVNGTALIQGDIRISSTFPRIYLADSNNNSDFSIINANGYFGIYDDTNFAYRLQIDSSGDANFYQDVTIAGNLTVNGTTTTIDTTNTNVKDNNITLNYSTGDSSATANNAGITIQDAVDASTDATILWDSTNDRFVFSNTLEVPTGQRIYFGDSSNMSIRWDTDAHFTNGSGDMFISNGADDKDIIFRCDNGSGGLSYYITLDGSEVVTKFSENTKHTDNTIAYFGEGNDLQIYHDGTTSIIDNFTGALAIRQQVDDGDVIIQSDNGSGGQAYYFQADGSSGEAKLFHYGTEKIKTTSTGVDVTGTISSDAITSSGNITFSPSGDYYVGLGSTNALHFENSSGQTLMSTASVDIRIDANNSDTNRFFSVSHNSSSNATSAGTDLFKITESGDSTFAGTISSGAISSSSTITATSHLISDNSGGGSVVGKTSGSNEWFVGGMTAGLGAGDGLLLYTYDSGSNIKFYVAGSHKFTMTNGGAFQVGSTTVIDSSRNLTNIGTISASGDMAIDTNALFVDTSTNRVGINTSSPDGELDVRSGSVATIQAKATSTDSTARVMVLNDARAYSFRIHTNDELHIKDETADTVALTFDTSQNATFAGSTVLTGDTRIGTSDISGTHALKVYHTDNFEAAKFQTSVAGSLARFTNTTAAIEIGNQNGEAVLRTGSQVRLAANASGNVRVATGDLQIGSTTVIDSSRNLTNIGTISTSVAMASSPSNIIYMAMSGTNQNGGGGAIRFDTSASNTDSTLFYSSVEGVRSASSNGSGELHFFTTKAGVNGDAPTRKMTIDEDGNVGVGTSSPANLLHLESSSPIIRLLDTDTTAYALINANSSAGSLFIEADVGNTVANTQIGFKIDNATKATLNTGGSLDTLAGYSVGTTQVIDSSRNIVNVGTISSGAITTSALTTHTKSVYGDMDSENFYRIKFQDFGGIHNDVGIGQTESGSMGFNVQAGFKYVFNRGTSGNAVIIDGGGIDIKSGGLDINGIEVINSSRNLTNIGTISSGAITSTGQFSVNTGATGTLAQFRGADTDLLNIDGDSNAITLDARNVGAFNIEMQGTNALTIDNSQNATFAGTISSGAITSSGAVNAEDGIVTVTGNISSIGTYNSANETRASLGTYIDSFAYIDLASTNTAGSWIDFSAGNGVDFHGRIRYRTADSRFDIYANQSGTQVFEISNSGINVASGGIDIAGTEVITSARSLTNIGTINTSGNITAGNDINISGNELTFTDDTQSVSIRAADALKIQSDYNTGENKPIYLQPSATTEVTVATGQTTFAGDISLPDVKKIKLGTDNDLLLYHDSESVIEDAGTNGLIIKTDGPNISIDGGSDVMGKFIKDGAVELYYDNVKRLETTSSGVSMTNGLVVEGTTTFNDDVSFTGDITSNMNLVNNAISSGDITSTGDVVSTSANYIYHRVDQIDSGSITMGVTSGSADGFLVASNTGTNHVATAPTLQFFLDTDGGSLVEEVRIDAGGLDIRNGGLDINGTEVITSARNLTNIGLISSTRLNSNNGGYTISYSEGTGQYPNIRVQDTSGTNQYGEVSHINGDTKIRSYNGFFTNGSITFAGNSTYGSFDTSGDLNLNNDLSVTGALSKGSGSFKIDHPLKPETHHLVHSFVEGPQADNIYRGTIDLQNGRAVVDLDEWFGMTPGTFLALNRNLQTFVSNEEDWDPVRAKMMGSQLVIECKNKDSKSSVSWMVVGERQDKEIYASTLTDDMGKIIVEPVKEVVE